MLQSLRYDNFKGAVIKYNMRVNFSSETVRLPISAERQVCLFTEFNLKATINNSGTLEAGHYWAHIKDEDNRGWLKCNDTSVTATSLSILSNTSSGFLLHSNLSFWIMLQGGLTPHLICRCDFPHITPVQQENQLLALRFSI